MISQRLTPIVLGLLFGLTALGSAASAVVAPDISAELDLAKLPAGYGFQVQLRLTDSTENKSKPIIERMSLSFTE